MIYFLLSKFYFILLKNYHEFCYFYGKKTVYPNLLHNIIEEKNMKLHFITFWFFIPWNIATVIALSENVDINK